MTNVIEARGLTKRYGKVEAVRGVSLDVVEGICFGLLGPNGAGKTTTIELLEGIGRPSSGNVSFRGEPMSRRMRQRIGIQFQATALQDFLTVSETLRLFQGLYDSHKPIEDIVRQCALEELLQRDNRKLSGGQRQRLTIARAFLRNSSVLLFDEATSALDNESESVVQKALDEISKDKTVIAVAHRLSTIQDFDKIYVFDQGRIIEEGNHEELLDKKQHYYRLYELSKKG